MTVAVAEGPFADLRRHFLTSRGGMIGLVVVTILIMAALFAPLLSPYGPDDQMRQAILHAPGGGYPLGTDDVGRDVLSRLLFGARLSLSIGAVVVSLSFVAGTLLGLTAGFAGGIVDALVMRLMDIMLALPTLLLAIAVVAVLGPGLSNAMLAVSIVQLPAFVRLTRTAVMVELGKDYVSASRMAGAGRARLMFRTVLPNCLAPLIVQASLGFSTAILDTAALGFLGLGAQPPTPEWGTMLADALQFVQSAWWVVTFPGLAILLTVLGFNLVGDGLRDALDPRLKLG
ncbi:MAG TPA: ABC transporter permease subunit [Acetobacteraceae bacterium]|jgi:dipeptide transport system permease protein|nr:ABC transporter permease subunit [Acetobacteraceae bacterium]